MERVCVEPPVLLDRAGGAPLTAQLSGQLREAVLDGRIGAGDRLPSTRALALSLGVSRTVVTDAYAQLYAEGWLQGRHGSGTFVAARQGHRRCRRCDGRSWFGTGACRGLCGAAAARRERPTGDRLAAGDPVGRRNRPGRLAPRVADRGYGGARAVATAGRGPGRAARPARPSRRIPAPEPRRELLGRGHHGDERSREQPRPHRGRAARPGDAAGIEEPGWPAARAILTARGTRLVPCPVDEYGLVVEALPRGLRLIHTTPAHQTPLGGRLPVPRRQALLGWARRTGALIIEDDYDSEFRYDVAPLPALHSLDPGVVAYLGTTAKTLTPELGVGWLVAPHEVLDAVAEVRLSLADRTPVAGQHATAALIEDGYLERHVRRMRHEYARRRSAITSVLAGLPYPARLLGDTAGMHVVLELPAGVASAAADAARGRGIAVATLDRYFSGQARLHGLVLGYGGATLTAVTEGCEGLREIIEPLLCSARQPMLGGLR